MTVFAGKLNSRIGIRRHRAHHAPRSEFGPTPPTCATQTTPPYSPFFCRPKTKTKQDARLGTKIKIKENDRKKGESPMVIYRVDGGRGWGAFCGGCVRKRCWLEALGVLLLLAKCNPFGVLLVVVRAGLGSPWRGHTCISH
jgi:hypothetical protein